MDAVSENSSSTTTDQQFNAGHASTEQGFTGRFDQRAEFLARASS
jgi:hypothetical protein